MKNRENSAVLSAVFGRVGFYFAAIMSDRLCVCDPHTLAHLAPPLLYCCALAPVPHTFIDQETPSHDTGLVFCALQNIDSDLRAPALGRVTAEKIHRTIENFVFDALGFLRARARVELEKSQSLPVSLSVALAVRAHAIVKSMIEQETPQRGAFLLLYSVTCMRTLCDLSVLPDVLRAHTETPGSDRKSLVASKSVEMYSQATASVLCGVCADTIDEPGGETQKLLWHHCIDAVESLLDTCATRETHIDFPEAMRRRRARMALHACMMASEHLHPLAEATLLTRLETLLERHAFLHIDFLHAFLERANPHVAYVVVRWYIRKYPNHVSPETASQVSGDGVFLIDKFGSKQRDGGVTMEPIGKWEGALVIPVAKL
eukprot:GDKI01044652.1.p1 GENE.GDKI01044652.1~~GDKI01044652.1.p1  ORF type:complete len:429 (+),score=114.12 GDKI01044652.1:166-1287(+)